MKNFKFAMLAMISVVALTFTSCLGDSDNDTYISATGTAYSSTTVLLDNGLYVTSSSFTLTAGERIYLYGTVDEDDYNTAVSNLSNGGTGQVTLQSIWIAGICVDGSYEGDGDYTTETATDVDDVSWLTYGAFGNGYMQFVFDADYYYYTSGSYAYMYDPNVYMYVEDFDAGAQSLDLVLVYDSAESVVGSNSTYTQTNGELAVSFDVNSLYYRMYSAGLDDDDTIELTVKYVTDENYSLCSSSQELDGKFGYSTNYCYVSSFKRYYSVY